MSLHKGSYDYKGKLFMNQKLYCTGSIISSRFVVTAGGLCLTQNKFIKLTLEHSNIGGSKL